MFRFRKEELEGLVKVPKTKEDVLKKNETAEYLDQVAEKIKRFAIWAAVIVGGLILINVLSSTVYVEYGEIRVHFGILLLGLIRGAIEAWLTYWGFYYIGSMLKGYALLIQQNDYQAKAALYRMNNEKTEVQTDTTDVSDKHEQKEPEKIISEMRCPICGNINDIDNKFCTKCGKRF